MEKQGNFKMTKKSLDQVRVRSIKNVQQSIDPKLHWAYFNKSEEGNRQYNNFWRFHSML